MARGAWLSSVKAEFVCPYCERVIRVEWRVGDVTEDMADCSPKVHAAGGVRAESS